ncbi:MAG: hypothetical protein II966_00430 [Lachnospiraceae bacterium]|nr:hypothetical protein [Lachnospiraceae bacterium]
MALYEILEDVSKRQIEKTDTGDGRIMGVMLGRVVKNYNSNMPGRVSVVLLSREQGEGSGDEADNSRILWARVAMPSSGGIWGHYFIPESGDLVLVVFEQGNIERPYIIGCIPKVNDKILTGSIDEKNTYKKITTRNGSTITFEDAPTPEGGNDGDNDKITIETATGAHKILLDNEKKLIQITDKESNNLIKMETDAEKGHITVKAAKKLTIEVGDNITLELNGSSGATTLKTGKFTVQTDNSISLESQGGAEIKGTNVSAEGSSMLKLKSNGAVQVSGTPVKLG